MDSKWKRAWNDLLSEKRKDERELAVLRLVERQLRARPQVVREDPVIAELLEELERMRG